MTVALLGRRTEVLPVLWRLEARVGHSQWLENILAGELIQGFSAHHFDHLSEDDVADVGISEVGSRRPFERKRVDSLPCFGGTVHVIGDVVVGDQAAAVKQQLLDCHVLLAVLSEIGEIFCDPVCDVQLSPLGQNHD